MDVVVGVGFGFGFGLGFGLGAGACVGDADDDDEGCATADVEWCCLAAGCDPLGDEQPAASTASSAKPISDRFSVDDITSSPRSV